MEETVNTDLPAPTEEGVTPVSPYVYGSRFLLELDVQLYAPEKQLVHTSEYVYLPADSNELCHTANLQWTPRRNSTVDVYFIITREWHLYVCMCCLLYTSPSPRDATLSRMPSSA